MSAWEPRSALALAVKEAGFLYDPTQDIIYSRMHAWQYALGYCWAYDCSSPVVSMIIDCEAFYFTYGDRHWMIELWKGQYGLETGCEIGVYCDYVAPIVKHALDQHPVTTRAAGRVDLQPQSRFYQCARRPQDMLRMTSTLYRNGQMLLQRGPEAHWWLTGFKWGVFTPHTSDLTMDVEIDFPNDGMCAAFRGAATALGYQLHTKGSSSIAFTFHIPHTPQPASRGQLEGKMQNFNQSLVDGYNLMKGELKVGNNDPNAFTVARAAPVVAPVVSSAVSHLPRWASAAAKAIEREAAAAAEAARRLESEVAGEASSAYHQMLAYYEKKIWRTTRRPTLDA